MEQLLNELINGLDTFEVLSSEDKITIEASVGTVDTSSFSLLQKLNFDNLLKSIDIKNAINNSINDNDKLLQSIVSCNKSEFELITLLCELVFKADFILDNAKIETALGKSNKTKLIGNLFAIKGKNGIIHHFINNVLSTGTNITVDCANSLISGYSKLEYDLTNASSISLNGNKFKIEFTNDFKAKLELDKIAKLEKANLEKANLELAKVKSEFANTYAKFTSSKNELISMGLSEANAITVALKGYNPLEIELIQSQLSKVESQAITA